MKTTRTQYRKQLRLMVYFTQSILFVSTGIRKNGIADGLMDKLNNEFGPIDRSECEYMVKYSLWCRRGVQ